ncbi:MAG: peptidylprolyl isomerase [Candidatus Krumholzibacteriia bacterium]
MTRLFGALLLSSLFAATAALALPADTDVPLVRLNTDEGAILVALFPDLAPHHVANFLQLASSGFYDDTYFHRIIPGFMIQGGDNNTKDFDPRNDGQGNPGLANLITPQEKAEIEAIEASLAARGYTGSLMDTPVFLKAEFSQTAKHLRGTLSMARRSRPVDSAGSQFFICHERGQSTANLDGQYTIFGQVVTGMDVVDRIATAPVDRRKGENFPANPVHITSCEVTTGIGSLSAEEQVAYHEMIKFLADNDSVW